MDVSCIGSIYAQLQNPLYLEPYLEILFFIAFGITLGIDYMYMKVYDKKMHLVKLGIMKILVLVSSLLFLKFGFHILTSMKPLIN